MQALGCVRCGVRIAGGDGDVGDIRPVVPATFLAAAAVADYPSGEGRVRCSVRVCGGEDGWARVGLRWACELVAPPCGSGRCPNIFIERTRAPGSVFDIGGGRMCFNEYGRSPLAEFAYASNPPEFVKQVPTCDVRKDEDEYVL
jgi:hypothetical protein